MNCTKWCCIHTLKNCWTVVDIVARSAENASFFSCYKPDIPILMILNCTFRFNRNNMYSNLHIITIHLLLFPVVVYLMKTDVAMSRAISPHQTTKRIIIQCINLADPKNRVIWGRLGELWLKTKMDEKDRCTNNQIARRAGTCRRGSVWRWVEPCPADSEFQQLLMSAAGRNLAKCWDVMIIVHLCSDVSGYARSPSPR